jgi:glycerol uptake facilitator protein
MNPLMAEYIGTAILITLGNGVVANVLLNKTKGNGSGWIVITFGWAMAVYVGVFIATPYSGAHLNPAVTIGLALAGKFAWRQVAGYIIAQVLGAMTGAFLVWIVYLPHYRETEDPDIKLATFSTGPAIRNPIQNLIPEAAGTFILVFAVLYMSDPSILVQHEEGKIGLGAIGALPVALLVFAIGLSLGGPTGYAINPARDLGPRILHFLLPIGKKRDSDWKYSWVPLLGPILGAMLAAFFYLLLK